MIKFKEKIFVDGLVGEAYQTRKQRSTNKIIKKALEDFEGYKKNLENNTGSLFNPSSKGGFKEYKTRRDKFKEKSLKNLLSEESKNGNVSLNSLFNYGQKYGKRNK